MALSLSRFSWLWFGGKGKDQSPNGSSKKSINPLGEWGLGLMGESENPKLYSCVRMQNRKSKRKRKSREERSRMIDKEYDVVLVPSDGACLSGSESDDSDWSIGWLEPHGPCLQSDDEVDNSFAVLVPCYRQKEEPSIELLSATKNFLTDCQDGGREYMEQWLSSLQNF